MKSADITGSSLLSRVVVDLHQRPFPVSNDRVSSSSSSLVCLQTESEVECFTLSQTTEGLENIRVFVSLLHHEEFIIHNELVFIGFQKITTETE